MAIASWNGSQCQMDGNLSRWCIVDGKDGCFLLWSDCMGERLSRITAYLFDEDGVVYREPVASWFVFYLIPTRSQREMISSSLDLFAKSIASHGSSPMDYRSQTVSVSSEDDVPCGSHPIL